MHGKGQVVLWSFREHDIQLDSPEDKRRAIFKRLAQRWLRLMRTFDEIGKAALKATGGIERVSTALQPPEGRRSGS